MSLPPAKSTAAIHLLWDQMLDFGPARADLALAFFFEQLGSLIAADNALWFGAVRVARGAIARRDIAHGWRSPVICPWKIDPKIAELTRLFNASLESKNAFCIGATTIQLMATAGTHRVHQLRDGWIDFAAFRETQHYEMYYEKAGIADRLWIGFPVNADTESIFTFDRNSPHRPFTPAQKATAAYAVRGIKHFHRQLLLRHGLMAANARLSPTEWKMVPHLLTDRTEKEIAAIMDLTFDATHKHARGIYQKFAVRGRVGLMALWHSWSYSGG